MLGRQPTEVRWPPADHSPGALPQAEAPTARPIGRDQEPERGLVPRLTAVDIKLHMTFLPDDDPDASLGFYRDTLGFELRNDVAYGGMRWITVGPADEPGTSIVLHPPAADPGSTDDERRTIVEVRAQGPTPASSWPPPTSTRATNSWRPASTRAQVTCSRRPWTRSGLRPAISCWAE